MKYYQVKQEHQTSSKCHFRFLIFEKEISREVFETAIDGFGGSWSSRPLNLVRI